MKVQDSTVIGLENHQSKKLQQLNGQTVTILHGSQFRDRETGNVLKIDPHLQNLVCTQQGTYLILNRDNLYVNVYEQDNFVHKMRTAAPDAYRFASCPYNEVKPEDKIVRDLHGNPVSKKTEEHIRVRAQEERAFMEAVKNIPCTEEVEQTQ